MQRLISFGVSYTSKSIFMKKIVLSLILSACCPGLFAQQGNQNFVTIDIDNFWIAYDQIRSTKDSTAQYNYLNELFLEKGSPGLKGIMEARNYTAKSYIDAINAYPLFWNSIRLNTLKAKEFVGSISAGVDEIRQLYPALKPAQIYFTIGALRTGGTTLKDRVLIGSEISMADQNTTTSEFPAAFSHLDPFFKTNPIKGLVFTNIHEYVHTQQKTTIANTLLGQCVMEGVAEFIAVMASKQSSTTPALSYGPANDAAIQKKFATQMYNPYTGFWLYSNAENEFRQRDLGYYVGYAICAQYYKRAKDKKKAIAEMIELDYDNEQELNRFVAQSGYFQESLQSIKSSFDQSRPTLIAMTPFSNQATSVDAKLTEITLTFSAAMDKRFRNFQLGPLGEKNLLKLKSFKGFSADGRSATIEVELQPGRQHQIVLGAGFRSLDGIALQPYLIDFKTAPHIEP